MSEVGQIKMVGATYRRYKLKVMLPLLTPVHYCLVDETFIVLHYGIMEVPMEEL